MTADGFTECLRTRVATNLDSDAYPAASFGELYHQRWRIEEAFKRLKHRLQLEAVSGLSQQAVIIDVAAKILADNIASILCAAAELGAGLAQRQRKCRRSYAATLLHRALPALLLTPMTDLARAIHALLSLLARTTQRFRPGRNRPRPPKHAKPHPSCVYKG